MKIGQKDFCRSGQNCGTILDRNRSQKYDSNKNKKISVKNLPV